MIDEVTRDLRGSPDRFGWERGAYAEILPNTKSIFARWAVHSAPEDWRDKSFLDVGCGMGRNGLWPMTSVPAEAVRSTSTSVRSPACGATSPAVRLVEVVRSSVYDLPFADRFDIAFAIGVLHHLEDPQRALRRMVRAVIPGGRVLIWVYGREGNRWLIFMLDPLRRALFSHMPVAVVHHLSLYPAAVLWLALKLGLRPSEYFKLLARFEFAHLRSIVFDQMLPRIAHYWPRERVAELMTEAGLEDVRIAAVNEMSWSAIGRRPRERREIMEG